MAGPNGSTHAPTTLSPTHTESDLQVVAPIVDVELNDRVVLEAEAEALLIQEGNVRVESGSLKRLEALGIYLKRNALKIQRGRALVSQQQVAEVMALLVNEARATAGSDHDKKTDRLCAVAFALGELSGKLTKSQEIIFEAARVSGGPGAPSPAYDPEPTAKVFATRQIVTPKTVVVAQNLHVHNQNQNP